MKYYFFRAFPALLYRNYQLWFAGQLTSLIGTWIQMVAQGWLVLKLTDSALWVGIIGALNTIPVLLLSLFAGVLVDKFSKKRILFITEFSSMILAFTLGFLTISGSVTVYHVAILAFLLGVVSAIDIPARLAFSSEMVEKNSLSSALALNAGMFNGARVVGPGIAGYLITLVGLGGAFIVNGISFIGVLVALFFIKPNPHTPKIHSHPLLAIQQAISYSINHKVIKNLLIYTGITSVLGWSYLIIMPVVVKDVYHMDVSGLGFFNAIAGCGALTAAIIVSAFGRKVKPWKFIVGGGVLLSLSLIVFSLTSFVPLAVISLFFLGCGLVMQFSTTNSEIQHSVDNSYRGRVMSIYTLMFMGLTPIGSMQIGVLSEYFGPQMALLMGATCLLLCNLYFLYKKETIIPHH